MRVEGKTREKQDLKEKKRFKTLAMEHERNGTISGATSAVANDESMETSVVAFKVLKTLFYCVIMLTSLVGNTLLITITYRNRTMRTTTNNLIANMAVSDLVFPIFTVPRETAQIIVGHGRWFIGGIPGNVLCKIVPFSQDVSTAVSIQSLVVIAFDRFQAVKFPLKPAMITPNICRAIIALIWIVAMGIHSPYFYTFRLQVDKNHTYCRSIWEPAFETKSSQKLYFLVIFVVLISFPIIVITILYSAIAFEVWKQKGPMVHSKRERKLRENENRKVLKQVLSVVLLFISCITPVTIYGCLSHFVWDVQHLPAKMDIFKFFAFFILHSNAALNPCIYFVFNENYRKGLREIFFSCSRVFGGSVARRKSPSSTYDSRVERVSSRDTTRYYYI